MGKLQLIRSAFCLSLVLLAHSSFAGLPGGGFDDDPGLGGTPLGGGIPVETTLPGRSAPDPWVDQVKDGSDCAAGGTRDFANSCTWGAPEEETTPDRQTCGAGETQTPDGGCIRDTCGPYGRLQLTQAGGSCVCQYGMGRNFACLGPQGEETAPPVPACVGEVQQLLSQCQSTSQPVPGTCDDQAQFSAQRSQGNTTAQRIDGTRQTQASCEQTANFQRDYASALDQFAGQCSSSINRCVSSCQRAMDRASSCNHPLAQQYGQQARGVGSSCQGHSRKVAQAQQESNGIRTQAEASARQCQQESVASERNPNQSNPPSGGEADRSQPGAINTKVAGSPPGGETFRTGGDLDLNKSGGTPFDQGSQGLDERKASRTSSANDPFNTSGTLSSANSSPSGAQANSLLASLPPSGAAFRATGAEAPEDIENDRERVNPALGSGGTYGGGGGRRGVAGLRPLPRSGSASVEASELTTAAGVLPPDLNQFRPSWVTGMVRCQDANSAMAIILRRKMDTQCIHGPAKSLFDAMKYRYEVQTMDNRFFSE